MSRTLTKKLAAIKPGMLLVGIDLGKQTNVAVVIGNPQQTSDITLTIA